MIKRVLEQELTKRLFQGKAIILFGARQVGKTTLSKELIRKFGDEAKYINCDTLAARSALSSHDENQLRSYLGNHKLFIFDEAQRVPNIGLTLKIITDTFPDKQIIATGSSSFSLANAILEPLTGRIFRYTLFPLLISELTAQFSESEIQTNLDKILSYGLYPEIYLLSNEEAKTRLDELATDYLYQDILLLDGIKKSAILLKLLQLLALQIGQEVSYEELAGKLGINRLTVIKYIELLEQAFIIFTLHSFSRNLRKELSKSIKIFFYDVGIRNSLIQNYNALDLRTDAGCLWENFLVAERIKLFNTRKIGCNFYFWRTYDQKEIDLVEERDGKLFAYEFKMSSSKKYKLPNDFKDAYGEVDFQLVSRDDFMKFLVI